MIVGALLGLLLPAVSLGWTVSLDLDSSLRTDSHWQESRNTGSYLRDSFRSQVLIPAFQVLVKGLKQNEDQDRVFCVACMAIILPIVLVLVYMVFLLKCKSKSKSGFGLGKGTASMVLPVTSDNTKEVETNEFKFRLS